MLVQKVERNVDREGDFEALVRNLSQSDLIEIARSMQPLKMFPVIDEYNSNGYGYARFKHIEVHLSRYAEGSRIRVIPLNPKDKKGIDDVYWAARRIGVDLYDGHKWAARKAEAGRMLRELGRSIPYILGRQEAA